MPSEQQIEAYVRTSNCIEHIAADWGDPLFDLHFAATSVVARLSPGQEWLTPCKIHSMIMPGGSDGGMPGVYRTGVVYVGDTVMPRPTVVPRLMQNHQRDLAVIRAGVAKGQLSRGKLSQLLRYHACQGLIIHPFLGGNGRTFRLYYNHLRRNFGLSWCSFKGLRWIDCLIQLRHYEQEFMRAHPECYEPPSTPSA